MILSKDSVYETDLFNILARVDTRLASLDDKVYNHFKGRRDTTQQYLSAA